jgi:RecJ-like exonuclease
MRFEEAIKEITEKFRVVSEGKIVRVISHLDTDGITAASIISKALQREDKKFSVRILKQLDTEVLKKIMEETFGKNEILFFLDLGTSSLDVINNCANAVFILDHHQFEKIPELNENIFYLNSRSFNEELSAAGLAFFFAKRMNEKNNDAELAILGIVGDMQDREISKMNNAIIKEANQKIKVKKGLKIFSSSRPVHKALEFGSDIFIPGVTGNSAGALNMLREIGINVKTEEGYRTLIDLDENEISRLVTAIILRRIEMFDIDKEADAILGNIYLIKLFNHFEDAREISTLINACGRLGHSDVALGFCLGSSNDKTRAEQIYSEYKHSLIKALTWVSSAKKIESENCVIIDAKKNIKDTIIGTIISIIASSFLYPNGTVIAGMAERDDGKIKVSMRISGRKGGINLRDLLVNISKVMDIEDFGGHEAAAGCLLPSCKEEAFAELLKHETKIEKISIKPC